MAFNNWDKLSKAQRDYPKPKFAVAVVDKALKKNPNNPFLCTWKADLSLRLNQNPNTVLLGLQQTCQLSGLTDTRLLSYLYKLCAETSRRLSTHVEINSVGTEFLKPWQNTAKTLARKNDRLGLWDALFNAAMREDCWEDVRFAVVNYNKEGAPSKKLAHYTHILVVQLAAEQKQDSLNHNAQMSQIQLGVARKLMKQAYEASPDDPIAVKDIRDLRFMADIFRRQDRCAELFSLWDNPPVRLRGLMKTHKDDLMSLKTRFLSQQEDWLLLESHCHAYIEEVISQLNLVQDSKCLWELCAWRWDLWNGLLRATNAIHDKQEGAKKISAIIERCFGTGFKAKDRPLRITYMCLRQFTGTPMLSECKEYWEHHSELSSCFADLRPFVEQLRVEDQTEFLKFITDKSREILVHVDTDKDAIESFERWQQAQQNVLKFNYLLEISQAKVPHFLGVEMFTHIAIKFCETCPKSPDAGFLAVYGLLHLHHQSVYQEEGLVPFQITSNARVLLQATMLARHLVARDKSKQNRTLSLLAARLHLNLGLGKCAFQLYSHAKCKEMLLDTLSPYVLSRISLTHPFDVKGYQGFSADEELAKVISTIERMENKTDDYLYTDMQSFVWDQAVDALDLKRRLKASLTKHICITERRRIARLKGETTENLPTLDYKAQGHDRISDNVDRLVFPNFETSASVGPLPFVMPAGIPDNHWLVESYNEWEACSSVLYREGAFLDPEPWKIQVIANPKEPDWDSMTSAEENLKTLWGMITLLSMEMLYPGSIKRDYEDHREGLLHEVCDMRKAMEKLRMPGATTLKPEDEPVMFHENMLMSCYTKLEALRALNKFLEQLRERVLNAKSTHSMKSKLSKDWADNLASETQICYQAIRDVAQSYINLIKKRGLAAIRAQVRWGKTGTILETLLKDDDVDYYASEYIESALEAWNGVLKVKLK